MTQFRRLLDALDKNGVRYIIVGGAAVELHGSAYKTNDLDVLYERSDENIRHLCDALRPLHPRLRVLQEPDGVRFRLDPNTIKNGANFTFITSLGDLDVLATITGIGDYQAALTSTEEFEIGPAHRVRVLSLDALITAKRAAGRKKDQLVLPELEAMLEIQRLADDQDRG